MTPIDDQEEESSPPESPEFSLRRLKAHINTLDEVVGPNYKWATNSMEVTRLSNLSANWLEYIAIAHPDKKELLFIIASMYRTILEREVIRLARVN